MANNGLNVPSSHNEKLPGRYSVKPAFQALLIFMLAHVLTLAITSGLGILAGWQIGLLSAVSLQGLLAALLTRYRKMARWWVVIQALFPLAFYWLMTWRMPSWIFLVFFVFLLSLYWTTFRTQVPFYPSGHATWQAVAAQLPANRPVNFIDIGSGMGGLLLQLASMRPDSKFTGIEIAPLPYCICWIRNAFSSNKASIIRGDYVALDFSVFDVVFAYLSPAAMDALWRKAQAEMRPGSLLISYEFNCPGRLPDRKIQPKSLGPELYVWKF